MRSTKGNKTKCFFVTQPRARAGWPKRLMNAHTRQTPQAGKDDSVSRFRHYQSTLINSDSNLYMRSTLLIPFFSPTTNRGFLSTPKESYDLNLSAITSSIRSFRTPNHFFTKNCTFLGDLLSSPQAGSLSAIKLPEKPMESS